jgi:hypothetical protein
VQQNEISYKIEFKIVDKNLDDFLIKVNFRYPNPSNLSINSSDILKVRTLKMIKVTKNKISHILPENIESKAKIPL